jgi:predicted HicB family RNase H-like nuclease
VQAEPTVEPTDVLYVRVPRVVAEQARAEARIRQVSLARFTARALTFYLVERFDWKDPNEGRALP